MRASSAILSVCAILALSTTVVMAKRGSIGIYAIVDKVEFQPSEESPERILIRGVFVVPVPMSSGDYRPPARGYLYFSIPPAMAEVVKQEWRELKAFAGTGEGIGFAQYWEANSADSEPSSESLRVRVHRDGEAAVPDVYPQPNAKGIVEAGDKADPDFEKIVAQLRNAARD